MLPESELPETWIGTGACAAGSSEAQRKSSGTSAGVLLTLPSLMRSGWSFPGSYSRDSSLSNASNPGICTARSTGRNRGYPSTGYVLRSNKTAQGPNRTEVLGAFRARRERGARLTMRVGKKEGAFRPPLKHPVERSLVAVPASAAVSATAAPAAAAARLGPRLVDRERPSAELLARKGRDGVASLAVISELDETEALRPPGLPVGDHGHGLDVAVLGEEIAKILF